jgi:peptidoglycan hydrolase CwlO-like protein
LFLQIRKEFGKKNGALLQFLFGNSSSVQSQNFYHENQTINDLEEKLQRLQNQLDSLQQKVIHLETNLENQSIVKDPNLASQTAPEGLRNMLSETKIKLLKRRKLFSRVIIP